MVQEHAYLQWLSGRTPTLYWHDSAIQAEKTTAFHNGAVGMTTNPFLVNATLRSDTAFWTDALRKLPKGLQGDEKAEALMHLVIGHYAKEVHVLKERGEYGKGYVCAQTNPNRTGDAAYMLAQAKRYATWGDNIVIKLPATAAGMEALEECVALGYHVAATVSFTVPQVLAAAQAYERGAKRAVQNGATPGLGIAVIMVGRLDDYLRDVAQDCKNSVRESDIVLAGTACIKRAYTLFAQQGYSMTLMPAGCRGASQVLDLAGANMIMSIAPKIVDMIPPDAPQEERIELPVEKDVIDRLMTLSEFRNAYEPDGMQPTDFITFGSTNRTTDQFINDGWNPLLSYEYA